MGSILFLPMNDISRADLVAGSRGIDVDQAGQIHGVEAFEVLAGGFEILDEFGLTFVGSGFAQASFDGRGVDAPDRYSNFGNANVEVEFDTWQNNTLSTSERAFTFIGFGTFDFGSLPGPTLHGDVTVSDRQVQYPEVDSDIPGGQIFLASSFHLIGDSIDIDGSGSISLHSGFQSAASDFFVTWEGFQDFDITGDSVDILASTSAI